MTGETFFQLHYHLTDTERLFDLAQGIAARRRWLKKHDARCRSFTWYARGLLRRGIAFLILAAVLASRLAKGFIRPGGRSLSIWERMSQKNYVDALIVSSNLTMVKTTKLGSTLRDHAHDGRGCTCSLMQDAPELSLEPLPRPEEIGLRTARNYDMMQRVSETTSAKRAEMRRLLTVVQGRFQSGDQATRNHYRDLELRLKEALRML